MKEMRKTHVVLFSHFWEKRPQHECTKMDKLILHIFSQIGLSSVHIYIPTHWDGPEIRIVSDGFEAQTKSEMDCYHLV